MASPSIVDRVQFAARVRYAFGRIMTVVTVVVASIALFYTVLALIYAPLLMLWSEAMAERLSTADYHGVSVALIIVVFGLLTWLLLGVTAIRNRNAVFFVAVQFVLLAGALLVGG